MRRRPRIKTGAPRKPGKIKAEAEQFEIKTIKLSANSIFKEELIITSKYRCITATRISFFASMLLLYKVNLAREIGDGDFFMGKVGRVEIRNCFLAVTMEHIDQMPNHF